jgi:pimeloyl-ACP methyl ester carboxylesterase
MRLVAVLIFCCVRLAAADPLFAKPGKMIPVENGSRLSLYCLGKGSPTVVLESGFGGGSAATWSRLQPLLASVTRTCSYDRAGYGFSTLGANVPRDLRRAVRDLATMLERSGERPPYILGGHSNGGLLAGAFADLYPERVSGLMFFDAATVFADDEVHGGPLPPSSTSHLESIRRCLQRAETGALVATKGDPCVDLDWYAGLPKALAKAEIENRSKRDYWRAYLSEAEENYASRWSSQARALLPHRWQKVRMLVLVASASLLDDAAAAKAFGLPPGDIAALNEARANRERGESRQRRLCEFASDCRLIPVPSANHLVHNEALSAVLEWLGRSRT